MYDLFQVVEQDFTANAALGVQKIAWTTSAIYKPGIVLIVKMDIQGKCVNQVYRIKFKFHLIPYYLSFYLSQMNGNVSYASHPVEQQAAV